MTTSVCRVARMAQCTEYVATTLQILTGTFQLLYIYTVHLLYNFQCLSVCCVGGLSLVMVKIDILSLLISFE